MKTPTVLENWPLLFSTEGKAKLDSTLELVGGILSEGSRQKSLGYT